MIQIICAFVGGLLCGWWFIPQPQWAKDLYTKIFGNKTV